MPIPLSPIDVSGVGVGGLFALDLTQILGQTGVPAMTTLRGNVPNRPVIRVHNESGSGLQWTMPYSGQGAHLPAGGWVDLFPRPGEIRVNFRVLYLLPNPPVSLVLATYYESTELLPPMPILGNSPIGIGGTISTSSVNSLINDGNPPGTQIIEATPSDAASSTIQVDNAGNISVKGDNAGSLTTLLQLIAGATPAVKLAAATVLTEILGNLQVDSGKIGVASSGDILDASATTNVYVKARAAGSIHFQIPDGTNVADINNSASVGSSNGNGGGLTVDKVFFFLGAIKSVGGDTAIACGAGTTITHGLGGTPGFIACTPSLAQPGSATVGIGSIGATTFRASVGAGSNLAWIGGR